MAIANGTISYLPNKKILRFEEDLAFLPSLFSKNKDLILMPQYEDLEHIELLHSLSFPIPGQILQSDFFEEHQKIISSINSYQLWGWAPNWIHRLKRNTNISVLKASPFYNWNHQHKQLYSRETAQQILKSILTQVKHSNYIPTKFLPKKLTKLEDVDAFLSKHRQIVLKEPWSSSGRGIIMLRKNLLNDAIKNRVKSIIKQQTYIMAEPLMHKLLDMSMHFKITNRSVLYQGESYFKTNSNGQYQANYLNQFPDDVDSESISFVREYKLTLKNDLEKAILQSKIPESFEGYFGVDIMLIKLDGKLLFQPCVEINLRYNMGTAALHLQKIIHPEAKGTLNIVLDTKKTFEQVYKSVEKEQIVEDSRILKGTLPLVSVKGKRFGAFINLD